MPPPVDCATSWVPASATTFNGQHITNDGTLHTTGKLTAAHDSLTVAADNGSYGAAASAAADLWTGKVHLYALAYSPPGGAIAQARLTDTLHFTIAGASASTVIHPGQLPLRWQVAGQSQPAYGVGRAQLQLLVR